MYLLNKDHYQETESLAMMKLSKFCFISLEECTTDITDHCKAITNNSYLKAKL